MVFARTFAIGRCMANVLCRPETTAMVGLTLAILCCDYSPSRRSIPPSVEGWPTSSHLARDPELPTLIMFAHPRCACTTTSLIELGELMSRFEGKIRGYVLFAEQEQDPAVTSTANWIAAQEIHGVTVLVDGANREAGLFAATTSGKVMLYDAQGLLAFDGGIAPMRGQRDTPLVRGLVSAIELAGGGQPIVARVQMPNATSGCPLRGDQNAGPGGTAPR